MAAYRQVYDSRHVQADCQEPGSAPEPYARQSTMGYLYLFMPRGLYTAHELTCNKSTQLDVAFIGHARQCITAIHVLRI